MMPGAPFDPFRGGYGAALKADPLLALEAKLSGAQRDVHATSIKLEAIEVSFGDGIPPRDHPAVAAHDVAQDDFDDAVSALRDVCDEIAAVPAATTEGVRVKLSAARFFLHFYHRDHVGNVNYEAMEPQERLAARAIEDMERLAVTS
jgi:hypothetical protein